MSQKKVDEYKKNKVNRDKIAKKEKRMLFLEKTVGIVVCLLAVAWIGYSAYGKITENQETQTTQTEMDVSAINNYTSELAQELTSE